MRLVEKFKIIELLETIAVLNSEVQQTAPIGTTVWETTEKIDDRLADITEILNVL